MTRRRRQVFDDGLDRIERVDAADLTLEEIREWVSGTGFLRMMRDVLKSWRAYKKRYPERMGSPNDPLSLAAHYQKIRGAVRALHKRLRRNPEQEAIVDLALSLGAWITEGAWRANRRPWTLTGKRRHAQTGQASRKAVDARHAVQREGDARIKELHRALRKRHPYDREHSTTWVAKEIGRKLPRPWETVRSVLKRLGLR
jgi:hypothetical protein